MRVTGEPEPPAAVEPVNAAGCDTGPIERAICAVFGADGPDAIAIAGCESGRDTMGRLDGWWASSGSSYGLFQINAIHAGRWPDFWSAWMTERNIAYAYEIWSEQGWSPWACRWAVY